MRDKVVYAFLREDNTPFYIGMGSIDRARNHKKGSRNYRWWLEMKANPNYKFVIVDRSLTKQQAWDIEIDLVKEFGRQHIDSGGILTNIHPGGSFWGESAKTSIVQFDLDGHKVNRFDSAINAGRFLFDKLGGTHYEGRDRGHFYQANITANCVGRCKSVKEYVWLYESEVGDIDYIGPVERKYDTGGGNTSRRCLINLKSLDVFGSSIKAWMDYSGGKNNWPSGSKVDYLEKNGYLEISKEEYNYFKSLEL